MRPFAELGHRGQVGRLRRLVAEALAAYDVRPVRVAEGELETEIRRLQHLGARRVRYVENDPDESHWIMADPEGNEFCCVRPPWGPRQPRPER